MNVATLRKPVRTPNIRLLAAMFEKSHFAVSVQCPSAGEDFSTGIHGNFNVGVELLEHFLNLFWRCLIGDDVDHFFTVNVGG